MDAMALVHSRIRRVVYAAPSTDGALATNHHVHTLRSLNHRYRAFVLRDPPPPASTKGSAGDAGPIAAAGRSLGAASALSAPASSLSGPTLLAFWQSFRGTTPVDF
jgi:hypothetical protein